MNVVYVSKNNLSFLFCQYYFLDNLQILSVLSHTYIRKPNESNEQLLLCLWQSDHHLEQVAVRDNLHITILQFRQALGYG